MSRTIRRPPPVGYFRRPRGHKQALLAGVRRGAIPPDSYDDIPFSREAWQHWQVARKMARDGASEKRIVRSLVDKWKLTHRQAAEVADCAIRWYSKRTRSSTG